MKELAKNHLNFLNEVFCLNTLYYHKTENSWQISKVEDPDFYDLTLPEGGPRILIFRLENRPNRTVCKNRSKRAIFLIGNKNSNVLKMRWVVLHPNFELLWISQPWSWPTPSHVAKSSSLSTDWLLWNEFARFHNSMFLITNLNVLALPKILKGIKRMHSQCC